MKPVNRSKLASFFHDALCVIFVLYGAWLALSILGAAVIIINPHSWVSRLYLNTTMFELIPLDQAQKYTVACTAPASSIEMKLLGYFTWRTGDRLLNALFFLGFFLSQGLYLVVINQLRKILDTIKEGIPFANENIRRIRTLGFCLIGAELVRILVGYFFITYLKGTLSVPGARLLYLDFAFYWEWLNLGVIFAGFIILVIAEVFKIGIHLREEQELTI